MDSEEGWCISKKVEKRLAITRESGGRSFRHFDLFFEGEGVGWGGRDLGNLIKGPEVADES